jgi:enoyl-CoA hydratase/carnithine racemase
MALRDCRKPTIAAVSGYGMGGGCALALACDFRVGDATTKMGIPAARLGVVYGELDCAMLYRQVGLANAKRVLYTGRAFDVSECAAMGLVDIVAADTALDGARALAAGIADNAPLSLAGSKLVLEALAAGSTAARRAEIAASIEGAMNSADYREGARAFLEKRKPAFTGR